jgi:hypothetical protein
LPVSTNWLWSWKLSVSYDITDKIVNKKKYRGHDNSLDFFYKGPSWPWSYGSWIYNYLCNQYLSPLMLWVRILIRARCTTLCDKVCQWLATGRWFSPVSPTNKTDHHDITEILLKVALNTIKQTNKHIWYSITLHKIVITNIVHE